MTALTIVQNACDRLLISRPGAVFSSTDDQVIQLRGLMNQDGKELASRHNWNELVVETSFTTVATNAQTAVATDFDHIVNDSMWNRTQNRPIFGPLTAQRWQQEQSGPTYTVNNLAYRFRGGQVLLTPTPTAGESVYYEYVSTNWAETSGGTGLSTMTADDDVAVLDEELITKGLVWRYLHAKGFDYAEAFRTWDMEVNKAIARDGGAPVLNIGQTKQRIWPNVKEGSWP